MPRKPKEERIMQREEVTENSNDKIEQNIGSDIEVTFDEESDEEELEDLE